MFSFYKLENGKPQVGQGEIIPDGFVEYVTGNEPTELLEALELEQTEQELIKQVQEAKLFLDKSDKKVMPYYEFEEGDNTLEWYIEERSKARQFIRDNKVGGN